uniref:Uncharacterized protein n=1 Tax=viral metagenome TaxID=1070528 RepID=A0A6C0CQ77_9ZZZZ
MDCVEWIQLPQYPGESIHLWMNMIYERYSIYRSIIVCRNIAHLKQVSYELKKLDVLVCILRNIWDLHNFETSSYRIILITFDQYFHYIEAFNSYIYKNYYCMILQELLSLQEQYCLHKLYQGLEHALLEKYYIILN